MRDTPRRTRMSPSIKKTQRSGSEKTLPDVPVGAGMDAKTPAPQRAGLACGTLPDFPPAARTSQTLPPDLAHGAPGRVRAAPQFPRAGLGRGHAPLPQRTERIGTFPHALGRIPLTLKTETSDGRDAAAACHAFPFLAAAPLQGRKRRTSRPRRRTRDHLRQKNSPAIPADPRPEQGQGSDPVAAKQRLPGVTAGKDGPHGMPPQPAFRLPALRRTAFGGRHAPPSSPRTIYPAAPQHFLYFLPLPQGQGSLRPTLGSSRR